MNTNVGAVDRTLRTVVGAVAGGVSVAILTGIVSLPTVLSPVLGIIAIMMLTTTSIATCPAYSLFGVDSCSSNSSPQ
ncbi:DUF2892 domain-containing protein [Halorubrum sp. CGM5_25_10-8B]|uniref:YgaP family membrane protein n=1 Tax=Halorubrum sp. CGM5_25_10-8B TaxID=2518115 RepID=UPI0010F63A4B|nr:DUF2892 domain-containing protein [Halorubrum sp. CGM5_25_10-8B]TKX37001.1 DUF2892 domain-containing protein [Halorubrum sp. CGM5_25_10-8B]